MMLVGWLGVFGIESCRWMTMVDASESMVGGSVEEEDLGSI